VKILFPRLLSPVVTIAALTAGVVAATPPVPYEAPPHRYWEQPLDDAFSRWWRQATPTPPGLPPAADEREAVRRVLAALQIPESSQMLVFSATSLQRTIGPHRPRALYFNDELYLGWVPGGRLEIAADDPQVGPVFFIASLSRDGRLGEPERQTRCLNCHGNADTGNRPALLSTSVLSDDDGGSLETFREPGSGHQIPLAARFGGWHVTDAAPAVAPLANLIGASSDGRTRRLPNAAGDRFDLDDYLRPTSRLLPQLVHEHQLGGVNLLTAAHYRARELAPAEAGPPTPEAAAELDALATRLVQYLLFADEAALPEGGVPDDPDFARDFAANRRPDTLGRSLKDLDLRSRLFTYRGSYLLYTPLWLRLPPVIKDRVWRAMDAALDPESPTPSGRHLSAAERQAIRQIIADTCDDRPATWRP
jgi:hypothetical protein